MKVFLTNEEILDQLTKNIKETKSNSGFLKEIVKSVKERGSTIPFNANTLELHFSRFLNNTSSKSKRTILENLFVQLREIFSNDVVTAYNNYKLGEEVFYKDNIVKIKAFFDEQTVYVENEEILKLKELIQKLIPLFPNKYELFGLEKCNYKNDKHNIKIFCEGINLGDDLNFFYCWSCFWF